MKKIILSSLVVSSFLFGADFTNSIGMKFIEIPAGSFTMGTSIPDDLNCPKDNPFTKPNEYDDCFKERIGKEMEQSEAPAHKVDIAKSFYMQETEVTQGQWYEIMQSFPFSSVKYDNPVGKISWNDVQIFIEKLNKKEGINKYRLPTEEEWEYAARAGTTTKWYCGDSESCLSSIAVYTNSPEPVKSRGIFSVLNIPRDYTNSPDAVKSKKPNAWGLHDMIGNVWEMTSSCWTNDYNSKEDCSARVVRGGGAGNFAKDARSANRASVAPNGQLDNLGFRLVSTK